MSFKYKVVASYKDALRRQMHEALKINQTCTLTKRNEYGHNEICRLLPNMSEKEMEEQVELSLTEVLNYKKIFVNFKNAMENLSYIEKSKSGANNSSTYRYIKLAGESDTSLQPTKRVRMMQTPTPLHNARSPAPVIDDSPLSLSQKSDTDGIDAVRDSGT